MGPTGTGKIHICARGIKIQDCLDVSRKINGKHPLRSMMIQAHLYLLKFIKLLSNDDNIHIGHSIESETIDVSTTSYSEAGRVVTLVDTPGFDDSREGVTDTDILEKIAKALQEG